jgi:hypothetical protein
VRPAFAGDPHDVANFLITFLVEGLGLNDAEIALGVGAIEYCAGEERARRMAAVAERRCEGCGCSESQACEGGCIWAKTLAFALERWPELPEAEKLKRVELWPESNPFRARVKKWLDINVAIPGYDLEDPELDLIAATIREPAHLEQFQQAAKLQARPKGWKVFVRIAQQCQARHDKWAAAHQARTNPFGVSK